MTGPQLFVTAEFHCIALLYAQSVCVMWALAIFLNHLLLFYTNIIFLILYSMLLKLLQFMSITPSVTCFRFFFNFSVQYKPSIEFQLTFDLHTFKFIGQDKMLKKILCLSHKSSSINLANKKFICNYSKNLSYIKFNFIKRI